MADRLTWDGVASVCSGGHYWMRCYGGFYQPVHAAARLPIHEVARPSMLCWGFRSGLQESSKTFANGTLPYHILSNLQEYSLESLPGKRRTDLRKCRRLVENLVLSTPDLLLAQGYAVVASARQRNNYMSNRHGDSKSFQRLMRRIASDTKYLVLAGVVKERLAGFLVGYAVAETAYMKNLYIATEYLPTAVGTGLVFDFVQICRQSARIREICYGQESPEDPNLGRFKVGMGFPVVMIPTRVCLPGLIRLLLEWRAPAKLHRLLGEPPEHPTCR